MVAIIDAWPALSAEVKAQLGAIVRAVASNGSHDRVAVNVEPHGTADATKLARGSPGDPIRPP